MTGRTLSRLHIGLVLILLALCGCGDEEATQRKAFIEFLQTRIVGKPGIHVPHLTAEETAAFGPYAKHYAVIADFNAALDDAVSKPMQQAIQNGTPHSLGEVVARRQDIAVVADGMAKMQAALDRELAKADAAHAALKQPDDLKPVYDAAYARDVTVPAKAWSEVFPDVEDGMKNMLALADFVAAHQNAVKIQGAMIQTSDPSLQPALTGMLDKIREKGEAVNKAQQRLNALIVGG
ncbi:MAG: DUF3053 family protein [Alphaproteobacteria bacterium]|nr:DUF3053 family protein [Alphaproteobacteria bacterium]